MKRSKLRHVEIEYSCGKTRSKLAIFSSAHRRGGVKWVLKFIIICMFIENHSIILWKHSVNLLVAIMY